MTRPLKVEEGFQRIAFRRGIRFGLIQRYLAPQVEQQNVCMHVCMYYKSSHILFVCMYVCSKGHTYEGTFPNTYMYTQVMRKFILHLTMSQVR